MCFQDAVIKSAHDVVPLVTAFSSYAWPVTVLILAFFFRTPIEGLIARINRVKVGDNAVEFGAGTFDKKDIDFGRAPVERVNQLNALPEPKWERVLSIFWIGGDLLAAAQFTLRGAPKKRILHFLTQAHHHISEVGLAETDAGRYLALLKSEVESRSEDALTRDWRNDFSARIYDETRMMETILRVKQPDFRPSP
jgi:hypothetical protein